MLSQCGFGCLALACVLTMPITGRAQEMEYEVPPTIFTGPLSHPRYEDERLQTLIVLGKGIARRVQATFMENPDWRCSWFVGSTTAPDVPFAGIAADVFLGTTPVGGFSASLDAHASAVARGPGITLHFYPWEAISYSIRLDLLTGTVSSLTTVLP